MGTNNFHYENASKVFVVLESYEDLNEETGEEETIYPDEHDYDDLKDYLKELIEAQFNDVWDGKNVRDPNELRSYGSSVICRISHWVSLKGIDVRMFLDVIIRSGYYEAACLDWSLSYESNYYGGEDDEVDLDWCIDELEYCTDWNAGMVKIQAKNLLRKLEDAKESLVDRVEKIFEQVSTPYNKVAQFSDGTAMYTKS